MAYHDPGAPPASLAMPLLGPVPGPVAAPTVPAPDPTLRPAYDACRAVVRQYSASFYFSARLLPPAKRDATLALYAFCRLCDEAVDGAAARGLSVEAAGRELTAWSARCRPLDPPASETDPVVLAWADTRRRFGIPQVLADQLVIGIAMDVAISRYATWADLWMYCYRVASTVGQMSMRITGATHQAARNYAIRLGIALQLTNILRDVGADARAGRIYLPLADLARFNYAPDDLLAGVRDARFVALMRYEIARARALYAQAWPGIALLAPDSRLAVAAAATVYQAILDRIEAHDYDVFSRRAYVPTHAKLALLARALWQVRRMSDN